MVDTAKRDVRVNEVVSLWHPSNNRKAELLTIYYFLEIYVVNIVPNLIRNHHFDKNKVDRTITSLENLVSNRKLLFCLKLTCQDLKLMGLFYYAMLLKWIKLIFFIQVVRAKVSFVRDFLERKLVDKVRRFVMLLYNQGQQIFMKADEPKKINWGKGIKLLINIIWSCRFLRILPYSDHGLL